MALLEKLGTVPEATFDDADLHQLYQAYVLLDPPGAPFHWCIWFLVCHCWLVFSCVSISLVQQDIDQSSKEIGVTRKTLESHGRLHAARIACLGTNQIYQPSCSQLAGKSGLGTHLPEFTD